MATKRAAPWRGSVFRRKKKLWLKVKTPAGWKNVKTRFSVGEEASARKLLALMRERLIAGEELGDAEQGAVTVRRWATRWSEARRGSVKNALCDERNINRHVVSKIGDMALEEVRPRHILNLVRELTNAGRAPRTIRNIGLAALRLGEGAGLRFRNLSLDAQPLGRIHVARSYANESTKTGRWRWMPIHPVLGAILSEWFERGWKEMFGRSPSPDDLVVPTRPPLRRKGKWRPAGEMRTKSYAEKWFWKRLKDLGMRHRRVHDLRRTFISLAREDGADKHILHRGTHQPPNDVMELYTTVEWRRLCEEVAKLRLTGVTALPRGSGVE